MNLAFVTAFAILFSGLGRGILPAGADLATDALDTELKVGSAFSSIAIPFEENRGQGDERVAFYARTLAGPLFVTRDGELVWSLRGTPAERGSAHDSSFMVRRQTKRLGTEPSAAGWAIVERFVGSTPKLSGAGLSPTRVSVFRGKDARKWRSNMPTWQRIALNEVWEGIKVSLAVRGNNVEKLFYDTGGLLHSPPCCKIPPQKNTKSHCFRGAECPLY